MTGWSLQYTSATGNFPSVTTSATNYFALPTATIQPGGFYLVQLAVGTAGTTALPTPDATGAIAMGGTGGKVALVASTAALGAVACPSGATLVDLVMYGAAAATTCSEGLTIGTTTSTQAVQRIANGCTDTNVNLNDFVVATAAPRNSATQLACTVFTQNESNAALEADYCNVQSPLSIGVAAGTAQTVYGQLYEVGVTEAAGANASVLAQFGYGPASANPEYEPGWSWQNATFNVQSGNNDEYAATFTTPASGSYRYAYRFSLDSGATWTVCDKNGAGSNSGLFFDFADEAVMTIP
jgi:hypothetical protein